MKQRIGRGLLAFAPVLMKTLSVVGTVAMFLVGGGIINHAVPWMHHFSEGTVKICAGYSERRQHCRQLPRTR